MRVHGFFYIVGNLKDCPLYLYCENYSIRDEFDVAS